jgi:hypothetical protein
LKEVPPSGGITSPLLSVDIAFDIMSVLDIQEVENIIVMQLSVDLTWVDSRISMYNLKLDQNINTLTDAYRNIIWIPEAVFYNTKQKLETQNDEKSFATIQRKGRLEVSPKSDLKNSYIFKGSENPISITRVYDSEFICLFDMSVFPFDTQKCSVIMVMKGNTGQFVELNPVNMTYSGPIDLTQYFIKGYSLSKTFTSAANTSSVTVNIFFGRRLLGAMLTTYLPSIIICIVSFSTNYFKAFFFEAVVTVNLTSLLTLTTLFLNISGSLPKTSYIKMIEVWLVVNLMVPFAEVLCHTYMDKLRTDEEREINHHGDVVRIKSGKWVEPSARGQRTVSPSQIKVKPLPGSDKDGTDAEVMDIEQKYERKIQVAYFIASKILPICFILFAIGYFIYGFAQYAKQFD